MMKVMCSVHKAVSYIDHRDHSPSAKGVIILGFREDFVNRMVQEIPPRGQVSLGEPSLDCLSRRPSVGTLSTKNGEKTT